MKCERFIKLGQRVLRLFLISGLLVGGTSTGFMLWSSNPASAFTVEITYDDGEVDGAFAQFEGGGRHAVRFTPPSYPITLETARIYLHPEWPDADHEEFGVEIYDDDGPSGKPGTLLGAINTTATHWEWWDVDISGFGIVITEGDFYISYLQIGASPDCEGFCYDTDLPIDGRSYEGYGSAWYKVVDPWDYMIRCRIDITPQLLEGTTGAVNCDTLSATTVELYQSGVSKRSAVSESNGDYILAVPEPGDYEVVASKAGYSNVTQPISLTAASTTLNFLGETGLVPNAPDLAYVLACINHWLYPVEPCGLSLSRVLAVINAWLYPQ